MDGVVHVEGLVKAFGSTRALDGLDLAVRPGEIHGFLGPNGSGKSTTIRILLGLLRADAGTVRLFGADPWRDAVALHRRLAYVPGEVTLWPRLTGGEVIDLLGRLRGGLDPVLRDRLLADFQLDPGRRTRSYSKGNRQKVALVAALASGAELLVLDEPTSGLDPLMEIVFQDAVREAAARGATVLLSSHILGEVEALCTRLTIIREGRTVQSGSLAELRRLTRSAVAVQTEAPAAAIAALPGVHGVHEDAGRLRFTVDDGAMESVVRALARHGLGSLTSTPPSLEELFVHHYRDGTDDAGARAQAAGAGKDDAGVGTEAVDAATDDAGRAP
ncbi:ATP-binding cassette domain-containing protein [Zafaria sp. Z1313]|uniref:ABC transporter ATP-binding protein n=1 Tax=unclassified Zafaria TaxID=2828765 RepID=UPI002E7A816A|nr:ABC transporter ATP-binding protein [Zafaria sp. J156]MEE1621740.1 ABC transporter ATP-binding protein [Zafaria sp. J156]